MLLLALAMITFWDSSFLPQGAAWFMGKQCLYRFAKDALERINLDALFGRTSSFRGNLGTVEKNRF